MRGYSYRRRRHFVFNARVRRTGAFMGADRGLVSGQGAGLSERRMVGVDSSVVSVRAWSRTCATVPPTSSGPCALNDAPPPWCCRVFRCGHDLTVGRVRGASARTHACLGANRHARATYRRQCHRAAQPDSGHLPLCAFRSARVVLGRQHLANRNLDRRTRGWIDGDRPLLLRAAAVQHHVLHVRADGDVRAVRADLVEDRLD